MKFKDKHYLNLQFSDKIYNKSGFEFQNFFETILEKYYSSEFQKIKPHGKEGDGGNDGYIKSKGIYFQVYSPFEPYIKENEACKKIRDDFEKLKKSGWENISKIREYYFVYNDKFSGSIQKIEMEIKKLEDENSNIKFGLFLAKDLKELFFKLDEYHQLDLGFNIDSREAIKIGLNNLKSIESELEKNSSWALDLLENISDSISVINDNTLNFEYRLLRARCYENLEKDYDAVAQYKELISQYPNNIQSYLFLAELYLNNDNFNENQAILNKAEQLNKDNWQLILLNWKRQYLLNENVNLADIDGDKYDDPHIRANIFRVRACMTYKNNIELAFDYINKAIELSPNKFNTHLIKLQFIFENVYKSENNFEKNANIDMFLQELEIMEEKFSFDKLVDSKKVIINHMKFFIFFHKRENSMAIEIAISTISIIFNLKLSKSIQEIISNFLNNLQFSTEIQNKITKYIIESREKIIPRLLESMLGQFIINKNLEEAKRFFLIIGENNYYEFLDNINNEKYNDALDFLKTEKNISKDLIYFLNGHYAFKDLLIEYISKNDSEKNKIIAINEYNKGNNVNAFEHMKKVNISELHSYESSKLLNLSYEMNAWDISIKLITSKLLHEKNKEKKLMLNIQMLNAFYKLHQFDKVISLGDEILKMELSILNNYEKEDVIRVIIIALIERSPIDNTLHKKALNIIQEHKIDTPSYNFKMGIETTVYLNNNRFDEALHAAIEAIKIKKILSHQEYAKLFFLFSMQLGSHINFSLVSKNFVEQNSFVKLKNTKQWHFVGDGNELDTIKIPSTNRKYKSLISKEKNEKIYFFQQYSQNTIEDTIELIYDIEQYIFHNVVENFNVLSPNGDVDGIEVFKIAEKDGEIDVGSFLEAINSLDNQNKDIIDHYSKGKIPFSILAKYEGSVNRGLWRIAEMKVGFINFGDTNDNLMNQTDIAKKIIYNHEPFYLDGTSAFFLVESGIIQKIIGNLKNIKIPQSVINYLISTKKDLSISSNKAKAFGFYGENIDLRNILDLISENFDKSINLLEKNAESIDVISSVNKANIYSEKEIFAELSDACILAKMNNESIITDDFMHLYLNSQETGKPISNYCSSFILIKTLYIEKLITLEDYLSYFNYVCWYRFRFISISSNEIVNAICSEDFDISYAISNIRRLNLHLILSEEYGVKFEQTLSIIAFSIFEIILIDLSTPEFIEKVFFEIVETVPINLSKKELSAKIYNLCTMIFNNMDNELTYSYNINMVINKFEWLKKVIMDKF